MIPGASPELVTPFPDTGTALKRRLPWILSALVVLSLLGWGAMRTVQPGGPQLTAAQAQDQLEDLGGRFSAAVENQRDVRPMLGEAQAIAQRFPDLRSAHQLRGQIHAQLGETDAAYAAFVRALDIEPADAELQNLAGTAAALIGQPDAAQTHFRRAVALSPGDARFRIRLGDTLFKAQRLEEAQTEFTHALTLRLMAHAADAGLGDVYAAQARTAHNPQARADLLRQAIGHTETALGKLPDDDAKTPAVRTVYARKLARHYHQQGDAEQACAIIESLPEENRFDPAVLAEFADYLNARGQPVVAALQYELAAQRNPTDPELLAKGAHWFRQAGDHHAARLLHDRLAAGWPRHPALGTSAP